MKITFLGNIRNQLIIALVLTVLFEVLAYNTTHDILTSSILHFLAFFIFAVIITTLTPKQLLFLVPFSMLSAVLYLNAYPTETAVINSIFLSASYFVVIYGIFFLLYDFWKNKNVNMSVIIAAILYFLAMIVFN